MPKSSMAIRAPRSWRARSIDRVRSGSLIAADSVTSITSVPGGMPEPSRHLARSSTRSMDCSSRSDTLKLAAVARPIAFHPQTCRHTSLRTHRPMASIMPSSSASGRNTPGRISCPSGLCHRIRASTPTGSASARLTMGW